MSGQPAKVDDLLSRRLALVADVSSLTAEAMKLKQTLAGVEMEALRCELAIKRGEAGEQLVQELHEANESAALLEQAQADCEDRIAAVEEEMRELDLAIAGSSRD